MLREPGRRGGYLNQRRESGNVGRKYDVTPDFTSLSASTIPWLTNVLVVTLIAGVIMLILCFWIGNGHWVFGSGTVIGHVCYYGQEFTKWLFFPKKRDFFVVWIHINKTNKKGPFSAWCVLGTLCRSRTVTAYALVLRLGKLHFVCLIFVFLAEGFKCSLMTDTGL